MFYGDSVNDTRQMFFSSWQKYRQKQVLSPLEEQIVDVIIAHPEYHALFDNHSTLNKGQAYFPEMGETNPFMHLGLHLAIRDQISMDRPLGIKSIYKSLLLKYNDPMQVEHLMIDSLAECLWKSQRAQSAPDEKEYLDALSKLC